MQIIFETARTADQNRETTGIEIVCLDVATLFTSISLLETTDYLCKYTTFYRLLPAYVSQ